MSEKNRAIITVGLIIFVLSATFLYQGISNYNRIIDRMIMSEEVQLSHVIADLEKFSYDPFRHRLDSLIKNNPDIVEAFALRDRQLLYKLALPKYESLRHESKYFHVMHFHLPNSTTFLRMHWPDFFADNLKGVRPVVNAVHLNRETMSGFEIGRQFLGAGRCHPGAE